MNDSSQESPTHIFAPDSITAWPKPADTYFWSRWKNRVSAFAIGLLQPGTFWVLAYSFLALPCLVSANGGIFAIETDTEVSQGAESLLDLNCNEFLVDGTFRLGSGRVDNASEVIISIGGTIVSAVSDFDGFAIKLRDGGRRSAPPVSRGRGVGRRREVDPARWRDSEQQGIVEIRSVEQVRLVVVRPVFV
ncbi:hypothetical protein, partial [Thiocapsa marina]